MATMGEKIIQVISSQALKNPAKLAKQQDYYKRLEKSGIAQKKTYNLKPVSTI